MLTLFYSQTKHLPHAILRNVDPHSTSSFASITAVIAATSSAPSIQLSQSL